MCGDVCIILCSCHFTRAIHKSQYLLYKVGAKFLKEGKNCYRMELNANMIAMDSVSTSIVWLIQGGLPCLPFSNCGFS